MANPHLKGTKYKKKIKPGNIKGKPHLDRAKAKPIRKDVQPKIKSKPKKISLSQALNRKALDKARVWRKKLTDKQRDDVKDAARGGFKSVGGMKTKGAITRIGQRVKKRDKAELLKLQGRR